uniref:ARAD1D26818p n=1 Tax=Blastobotrys adeninivorans TaxID=409370 RepID=A0A060TFY7_BLAAD
MSTTETVTKNARKSAKKSQGKVSNQGQQAPLEPAAVPAPSSAPPAAEPEVPVLQLQGKEVVLPPSPTLKAQTLTFEDVPLEEEYSKVAIIGCGFSGIAASIAMQDHFKEEDYTVVEGHHEVGGTWYANTYPGCASDIPAPWYSLSTDLNPNWSKFHPPQAEMGEYLKRVVDQRDIRRHVRFNSRVVKVQWDDDREVWKSTVINRETGRKYVLVSNIVFMGQGILVYPKHYEAPGIRDKFKGRYIHSAEWDSSIDLKDKNVIVIGNGCSAVQLVPSIAPEVKNVTQLVRSEQWLIPPPGKEVFASYKKLWSKSNFLMKVFRFLIFLGSESRAPMFNARNPLSYFVEKFFTWKARRHMQNNVPKEYQDIVIPKFRLGCKRMIVDNYYSKALHRENVNLSQDEIDYVTEHHVHTKAGKTYPADVIVACTGYDLDIGLNATPVYGRRGACVQERWKVEGATAYDTVLVDNCPNFFFLVGPNAGTGHSSVIFAIENEIMYIKKILDPVMKGKAHTVEVKSSAYQKWRESVQDALKTTVFGTPYGGCVSWYAKNNVNYTTYPWSQVYFWWRTKFPNWKDLKYTPVESKKSV